MKHKESQQPNDTPLILMYHGIMTDSESLPPNREIGADLYDVSLENFRNQMAWIKERRYDITTYDGHIPTGQEKIILTFDDGEMNNYTNAFPVLKEYNFPAYFFIIAKRVGKPGYMSWNELKQLKDAGMIIGSHGLSHEILTNLTDTQIEEELRASRKFLINNLETEINSLSIPRGFCNEKIIKIAHSVGYKHVFISERPVDLREICYERMAVKGNWSIQRFEQYVTGAIPLGEKIFIKIKNGFKKILRGGIYNQLRSLIIRLLQ